MSFNNTLHQLGFTPVEATVFITLCEHGSLTGYEVAKLTGISRSNVYSALYSLQEKGKCEVSEGETTKYMAISKEELIFSIQRHMTKLLKEVEQFFPTPLVSHEPYVTIKGYEHVLNKIKNIILLCESHLYLLSTCECITLLKDELIAISQKCRITIICDQPLDLGNQIKVYTRQKPPQGFHMIVDTKSVLTGELNHSPVQCLFSKNDSLVRLMRESFVTELDMIALKKH